MRTIWFHILMGYLNEFTNCTARIRRRNAKRKVRWIYKNIIDPFVPNAPFLYTLKRKGALGTNGLKHLYIYQNIFIKTLYEAIHSLQDMNTSKSTFVVARKEANMGEKQFALIKKNNCIFFSVFMSQSTHNGRIRSMFPLLKLWN